MNYIMLLISCMISSIVTIILRNWKTSSGTLRIDHTNPDKDVYRIEIDDIDSLKGKRYLRLNIDHNANLSQD